VSLTDNYHIGFYDKEYH